MESPNILDTINTSAVKLLASQSLEEICPTIVEEAQRLVDAEHGSIYLEKKGKLERVYVSSSFLPKMNIRKKSYMERAFHTRAVSVLPAAVIQKTQLELRTIGIQSIVIIPLSHRGESIGVLVLHSLKNEYFTSKELHILKLFSSMATLAIIKTRLYDQTKEALEIRDRFISLASHELRTPLTSLNGYIQLLYRRMAKKETVESRWVEELFTESTRLTNLVKDLLDINRIKQGQLAFFFKEIDMKILIEKAIEHCTKSAECKIVFVDQVVDKKYTVIGDSDRLFEMIRSLINNAIKFSHQPSIITVFLNRSKRKIRFTIQYHGSGLNKKDDIKMIFEGLSANGQTTSRDGMGVGFLFTKHIISHHRGKLRISSSERKGARVEVTLPSTKT